MAVMASYLFGNPNGATAATPQENVPLMPPAPKWVQIWLVKINTRLPSLPPSATSATLTWPPVMAMVATQSFRVAVVAETAYIKTINLQLFNALTGSILFKEKKTREFRKEDKKIVWGLGK
ncbi:hypothetical protein R3P38DRAFT_2768842 [Favolaschia claudopus]|uniref:ATP synthase F0 subunit 8 n=1 Tax=Favolaschia claudopus TaxID=2862362 RepID=A0AAW0CMX5_9AGAR